MFIARLGELLRGAYRTLGQRGLVDMNILMLVLYPLSRALACSEPWNIQLPIIQPLRISRSPPEFQLPRCRVKKYSSKALYRMPTQPI
ncbi:hypothetical protein BOTBODRAFT_268236 [Botryobasidium botryosum FD-172 SS1]|uniref:Uncharacterized protein n=1 Tax=Botryobasidium botryosum (strain FD-172 SS1) TaxID=930990 RepID=A0A067MN15_BOTB1|nr:hypothetical protein BOTBODRAFT_268236 [Botryobasidium botryosum FD-172 SS1]